MIHVHDEPRLTQKRAEKLVWLHYNLRIIDKVEIPEWEEIMHAIPDEDGSSSSDSSDSSSEHELT